MKLKTIIPTISGMDRHFLGNTSDCNDLPIVESYVSDTVYAAALMD